MSKSINGTTSDDTLEGTSSAELIESLAGDDIINGYGGDDILVGGAGNDTYVFGGSSSGASVIADAEGTDTLDAASADAGVTLDLRASGTSNVDGHSIALGGTIALGSQPLDLVLLQDLSGSFGDDVLKVQSLASTLVSEVQALNTDVQFGVSSFVDKPAGEFGSEYSGDYVYKTNLSLTSSGDDFKSALDGLTVFYGGDLPEAQLESLYQLALRGEEVGFRTEARKVVVLTTDATYHKAGDGLSAGISTENNGDDVLDGTPAGSGEDYPTVESVKAVLASSGIVPIFAVTSDQISTYEALVAELGVGVVTELASDSKNLVDLIGSSLEEISLSVDTIENAIGSAYSDKITANSLVNELTGGEGSDSFIYTAAQDIQGDVITDFADASVDKVDFSALTGYSFIGNADFTAANQIRYEIDADGNTAIQLSNSAKTVEYSMTLTGEFALAETKKGSLVLVGDTKVTPPEPTVDRIQLAENSDVDTVVVKSLASAAKDDEQRFEILEGNEDVDGDGDDAFAIDEETGKIVVNDSDDLDFEEYPTFDLVVGIDTNYGDSYDEKSIGIDLLDMPENSAPTVEDATFTIKENAKVKFKVGSIDASDDDGDDLSYTIVGGNLDLDGDGKKAFAINKDNGNITVTDNGDLNFEYSDTISLVVAVSDGVTDAVESNVTIELQNVKEKKVTLAGSKGIDILCGGEGDDIIKGNAGNDLLKGSAGKDKLTGGSGSDVFVFDVKPATNNVDTITDFTTKVDKIALSDAIFAELDASVSSSLDITQFYAATGATKGHDADDRIVYDTKSGALYYDEDGSGSTAAVKIAIIGDAGSAAKLAMSDFVIV